MPKVIPFEHASVSKTNQELHRISSAMMKTSVEVVTLLATYKNFSGNERISGDFQTKTAEIRQFELNINRTIASHKIKCSHCGQINAVSEWKLKRGHGGENIIVAGCPHCLKDWRFDGEYGTSVKNILRRAYLPTEDIFGKLV